MNIGIFVWIGLLTFFTNGRSVCLTELKGYHVTTGEPVCQPRRPNSRIDKVRYMFNAKKREVSSYSKNTRKHIE